MTASLRLTIDKAQIWIVPSVHFRLPFAVKVNGICAKEKPDAVVVELGPQTAAAAAQWLRELGVGPGGSQPLPCMLGLIKPNRRLRPSSRAIAILLQQLTGQALHQLPPETLFEYLHYSAVSALTLSSTDSIVEAMRCALEINCPVYGVDLDEAPERCLTSIMLKDPTDASDDLEAYVAGNADFAEQQRDEEVDSRRELAMAARLKWLAQRHQRLVFVCGLAHWRRLQTLLASAELQPAPYPEVRQNELTVFQRVIVHPSLAIYHVDKFPVLTETYESERKNASRRWTKFAAEPALDVFPQMLQETYRAQFVSDDSGEQLDRALEDWEARHDFEQLLGNLCTLRQIRTPDMAAALAAAEGVMSEPFRQRLAQTFMDIQWATPEMFPGLPVLSPSPLPPKHPQMSRRSMRAELTYPDGQTSNGFFVQSLPGRSANPMNIPFSWEWESAPPPCVPPLVEDGIETWVPTEDLINALLFRAVRVAREHGVGLQIEPFEGSLLGGVDMKTTLRSAARGEDQIFVRADARRSVRFMSSDEDMDGFPVVWIFRPLEGGEIAWKLSADDVEKLAATLGSEEWESAGLPASGNMITAVAAVTGSHDHKQLSTPDYNVVAETIVGKLSYWPQCCRRRTAEWAVESRLKHNPVCEFGGFDGLLDYYRQHLGFDVQQHSWHLTLIRMAIPMATKAITVVAPDGYVLPRLVYQEAAQRHVQVRVVPLSFFPSEVLRRISEVVWLPVVRREFDEEAQIDVPVYPEHVIRHFNEPMDKYRRLIAAKWH